MSVVLYKFKMGLNEQWSTNQTVNTNGSWKRTLNADFRPCFKMTTFIFLTFTLWVFSIWHLYCLLYFQFDCDWIMREMSSVVKRCLTGWLISSLCCPSPGVSQSSSSSRALLQTPGDVPIQGMILNKHSRIISPRQKNKGGKLESANAVK